MADELRDRLRKALKSLAKEEPPKPKAPWPSTLPERVRFLMGKGYAYPCAMCEHLWWGIERGLTVCRAGVEGKKCAGPMAGMAYPYYQGLLSPEAIATSCFRCGQKACKILEGNRDPGRYVGSCKRHLPMLNRVMEAPETKDL